MYKELMKEEYFAEGFIEKLYEKILSKIKDNEKFNLLDHLFIKDPDAMCKNFEHFNQRTEMYLDMKFDLLKDEEEIEPEEEIKIEEISDY